MEFLMMRMLVLVGVPIAFGVVYYSFVEKPRELFRWYVWITVADVSLIWATVVLSEGSFYHDGNTPQGYLAVVVCSLAPVLLSYVLASIFLPLQRRIFVWIGAISIPLLFWIGFIAGISVALEMGWASQ